VATGRDEATASRDLRQLAGLRIGWSNRLLDEKMLTTLQCGQPHRNMQLRATENIDDVQISSGQRRRGVTAVLGESEFRARLRRALALQITHNRQDDRAHVTK